MSECTVEVVCPCGTAGTHCHCTQAAVPHRHIREAPRCSCGLPAIECDGDHRAGEDLK